MIRDSFIFNGQPDAASFQKQQYETMERERRQKHEQERVQAEERRKKKVGVVVHKQEAIQNQFIAFKTVSKKIESENAE